MPRWRRARLSLNSGYRYTPITPLALSPGTYVVAGHSGINDPLLDYCGGISPAAPLTYGGGRFALGLGRGMDRMFKAFGLAPITTAQMEDFAGLMRRLWRGEVVLGHDGPAGRCG